MTAAAMAERASKTFVVSAAGPRRSALPPVARKVTKELCLLAFNAANDLCNEHGKALSAAFGNFDRVVALGWLIGDALGMPPVDRAVAHAAGLKARRAATDLQKDQTAARKESRTLARRPHGSPPTIRSGWS